MDGSRDAHLSLIAPVNGAYFDRSARAYIQNDAGLTETDIAPRSAFVTVFID
jgi:hypothetical protein